MAVTKIWAVHDSVARVVDYCQNPDKTKLSDLEQVLVYATDKTKTVDENETSYAVTGINCKAETAAKEMAAVQKRFGKTGGNVAYHAYQSFKTGEVSAEDCHRIGVETAKQVWGDNYQVLVATHFNTGTYHNHFVINSVGMWDGRKLEAKYKTYYDLRNTSDRICEKYKLTVLQDPQRHKTPRSIYFAEKNGEPTRYNLMREALDKAISLSGCHNDLCAVLRKLGYELSVDENRTYPTIRPIHSKKPTRLYRLGPAYEPEAIRERLLQNQWDPEVQRQYYEFMGAYTRNIYREPPTEEYYRRREFYKTAPTVVGYVSLLRCIAIVLGIEPFPKTQQFQKPLSPECREACRKLDRYTAELTLVASEHLDTPKDIQKYLEKVNGEIDRISVARNKIRNKQKYCTEPTKKDQLKHDCTACTKALAALRKKRTVANNILEDNPKIRELLKSEYAARTQTDPYLSEKEKRAATDPHTLTKTHNTWER